MNVSDLEQHENLLGICPLQPEGRLKFFQNLPFSAPNMIFWEESRIWTNQKTGHDDVIALEVNIQSGGQFKFHENSVLLHQNEATDC